jgi:hypothetical protein
VGGVGEVGSSEGFVAVSGRFGKDRPPGQLAGRRLVRHSAVALVVMWGLAACAVGPDYERPAVPVPPEWRTPTEGVGSLADLG